MKKETLLAVGSSLLAVIFAALAGVSAGTAAESSSTAASSPPPTPGAAATVTCAFSNPGYSGWCRVTQQLRQGARPRGFCSRVLTCLNDSRCIRTYCDATTIRGGWKLESVETAPKAP